MSDEKIPEYENQEDQGGRIVITKKGGIFSDRTNSLKEREHSKLYIRKRDGNQYKAIYLVRIVRY